MNETVSITAGAELDRAVSKASGLDVAPWASDPPRPSTDLNAAFAAAERVGELCLIKNKDHCRAIIFTESLSVAANAETPALATCAAILKLKETTD